MICDLWFGSEKMLSLLISAALVAKGAARGQRTACSHQDTAHIQFKHSVTFIIIEIPLMEIAFYYVNLILLRLASYF